MIWREIHSAVGFVVTPNDTPCAMPADDRLWAEYCNRAEDGREPTIEPNEQKAIGIAELWSLRYLPARHVELLAKD